MNVMIEPLRRLRAAVAAYLHALNQEFQRTVSLYRWGVMDTRVMASGNGGEPWEVAYLDEEGRCVGYWAHGYFDPHQPYTGQPAVFKGFEA